MDFSRIQSVIDIPVLQSKTVTIFGAGGSAGLIQDLTRSGIRSWKLVDPDRVGVENMSRQDHDPGDVGRFKVDAVRDKILGLNPGADVRTIRQDCTSMTDAEARDEFPNTDLFIAATDNHQCQAFVNRLSLIHTVSAVFIGLYPQALGGEVVWTDPARLDCCYRCLCPSRYQAHELAKVTGQSLDPTSMGADICGIRILDAIAVQIVIGLLTQGSENRMGRLIPQLDDRQFIQVTLSPDFQINGRDIVRERLGVAPGNPGYFSCNSVALADPDQGQLPCEDCRNFRQHQFFQVDGKWRRFTSPESRSTHPINSESQD
ncbi:MAG: ThiF family adenylyltransferase [Planctomycetaceae bacterium]|nr:ThiF family adenylyltransferase [Planctomycetaceae bacterium]